jgi:hypothetical protein
LFKKERVVMNGDGIEDIKVRLHRESAFRTGASHSRRKERKRKRILQGINVRTAPA